MKAYRLHEWQSELQLEDVDVPEPGPGEVLIKMAGAGVYSSDLHYAFEWSPETMPHLADWPLPVTLGHENGGWIEGGDPSLEKGTPVVVNCLWHCGNCQFCRTGETNYCEVAGLTSYHAVKQVLPMLQPGTTAVVIGVGGLGHLAVEFLRELTGAKIVAVDRDEAALKLAADRGADLCLPSDDTTVAEIKGATNGLGATAVLAQAAALGAQAVMTRQITASESVRPEPREFVGSLP